MSNDFASALKVAGAGLLAAGTLAAGAALGAAAERALMARTARRDDEWELEGFDAQIIELPAEDGTLLHVEIDEPDDPAAAGVTVIFAHGYALSLDSWYFQRKELQGRARLVTYDQRSHGRSGRAEFDTHHVDQLGRDLWHIIEAVAPTGPLVLIGHSMGGMTVMALAEQHPELFAERVYGVALVATTAGGLKQGSLGLPAALGGVVNRVVPIAAAALAKRKEVVEFGRRSSSDLALVLTRAYSFGSLASEQAGRFVARMIDATPIDVLAEFLPALQEHDKRAALPILQQTEVLVIVGSSDRLTPQAYSEEIVRAIPGAEFVVIPNGGHMVNIEFHGEVDALIGGLLDRVWRNVRSLRAAQ
ncbi:MAG: alpha/beta fold hydrolase [Candidatus Nanopelagicales bacterium]|jgi:pimeloyl-ACP methyl ester carboxylesterase